MPDPTPTPTPEVPANIPAKFIKDGKPDYALMAASYTELEKKLGTTPPAADGTKPDAGQGNAPPPKADDKPANQPDAKTFQTYEKEYVDTGKLSDEAYKDLETKYNLSKDVVNDFIAFRKASAESYTNKVYEAVGGEHAYKQMATWAAEHFNDAEKQAFDKSLASMDLNAAQIALGQLKTKYEQANGRDPKLVGGKTGGTSLVPFSNMREAVAFRSKPGWDTDPDMQREYRARLAISNIL
jgi:hypothetical protein